MSEQTTEHEGALDENQLIAERSRKLAIRRALPGPTFPNHYRRDALAACCMRSTMQSRRSR